MTQANRIGKKMIGAYVTLDEWRELRDVSTKTGRTQDDLLREAIPLLADKYAVHSQATRNGKKPAPRTKSARKLAHD
jgi:chitodextrinase